MQAILKNLCFVFISFSLFFTACAGLDTQGLNATGSDTNDSDGAPHVTPGGADSGFSDQGSQPVDIYAPLAKGYLDATTIDVGLSADMQEKYPELADEIVEKIVDDEATVLVAAGEDGSIEVCYSLANCVEEEVRDGWLVVDYNNSFEEPLVLSYPLSETVDVAIKVTVHEKKYAFMPDMGFTVDLSTSFKSLDQPLGILSDKVMFVSTHEDNNSPSVLSVPLKGGPVTTVTQTSNALANIQCAPNQEYCLGFDEQNSKLVYFENNGTSKAYSLSPGATEEFAISPDSLLVAQEARATVRGKQYSRIVIGAANPSHSQQIFVHQNNREVIARDFIWHNNRALIAITHYGNNDYILEYLDLNKSGLLADGVFLLSPTVLMNSKRPIQNVEKWTENKVTYECFDGKLNNGNLCVFDMNSKSLENAESVLVEAGSLGLRKEGVMISKHKWNADRSFALFDVRPYQADSYDLEDRSHFLLWGYKPGVKQTVFLKVGYRPTPDPQNARLAVYLSINEDGEKVVSVVNLAHYQ